MRVPHTGGERIKPGSPEEAVLKAWIQRLAALSGDRTREGAELQRYGASSDNRARPRAVLRRLTHSQYNNTVRDLLGDQTAPASQFPPEDFVNGFKDQYDAQNLSPLLAEAYSTAAEKWRATPSAMATRTACSVQAIGGMPRQVHPQFRPEGVSPAARSG